MLRFIIGVGRCGSTLLSTLLAEHPDVLMLSEFFGGMHVRKRFQSGDVTGQTLADDILRGDSEPANLWFARGFTIDESTYQHEATTAIEPGFRTPNMLTLPMAAMFPQDPVALFDEMLDWARQQPARPTSVHFPALFDWLTQRLGKKLWIERTGGSTGWFGELRRCFPDAHFLHLHRDGADSAMSMQRHAHFIQNVSYDAFPPSREELERSVNSSCADESDPVVQRFRQPPPIELFGAHWTHSLTRAFRELPFVRPDHYSEIAYEDVLSDPHDILQRIAVYFKLPEADGWIDRAAKRMRTGDKRRVDDLPTDARERLEQACYYGDVLLGRQSGQPPFVDASYVLDEIYEAQADRNRAYFDQLVRGRVDAMAKANAARPKAWS